MRHVRASNLLQRLGLVGAGLAIAAALFAFGGGLVAFGLWPDDLPHNGAQRMVLHAPAATAVPAVERRRRVAAAPRAVISQPRRTTPAVVEGAAIAPPAVGVTVAPREPVRPVEPPPAPIEPLPAPTEPEPAPVAPIAPQHPLQPVAEAVGQTTGTLTQMLDAVAAAVSEGLAAVGKLLGGPGR